MTGGSRWVEYYETLPGWQFRMRDEKLAAFEKAHPQRIIEVELAGRPERVVLLDQPFQLGQRFVGLEAWHLRRISLSSLPGWLPSMAPMGEGHRFSSLLESKLKTARFKRSGPEKGSVELTLEYQGETFKAWHKGCPILLLNCAVATLNQPEAAGKKLRDLQHMRLLGAD